MAITTAIGDLFHSFFELISSIFSAIYGIISGIVNAIVGFFSGVISMVGDVLEGLVNVTGGVGKFVASNIVVLSIGAALMFAYVRYTAQGQKTAGAAKKRV